MISFRRRWSSKSINSSWLCRFFSPSLQTGDPNDNQNLKQKFLSFLSAVTFFQNRNSNFFIFFKCLCLRYLPMKTIYRWSYHIVWSEIACFLKFIFFCFLKKITIFQKLHEWRDIKSILLRIKWRTHTRGKTSKTNCLLDWNSCCQTQQTIICIQNIRNISKKNYLTASKFLPHHSIVLLKRERETTKNIVIRFEHVRLDKINLLSKKKRIKDIITK